MSLNDEILTDPCNHCKNASIIEVDGIKRIVCCNSEYPKDRAKNDMICKHCCPHYEPNEEQQNYDEWQRTHSIYYDEDAEKRKERKRKRLENKLRKLEKLNATMA